LFCSLLFFFLFFFFLYFGFFLSSTYTHRNCSIKQHIHCFICVARTALVRRWR
jgi:hypothetical protein